MSFRSSYFFSERFRQALSRTETTSSVLSLPLTLELTTLKSPERCLSRQPALICTLVDVCGMIKSWHSVLRSSSRVCDISVHGDHHSGHPCVDPALGFSLLPVFLGSSVLFVRMQLPCFYSEAAVGQADNKGLRCGIAQECSLLFHHPIDWISFKWFRIP